MDPKSDPPRPYLVLSRCTLSLHEKARLRGLLETWRGKKFTAGEIDEGIDLEKLLGVNCQLQVVHAIKDEGETFANITAIIPAAKGSPKLRPSQVYVRVREREQRAELEKNPHGVAVDDSDVPF